MTKCVWDLSFYMQRIWAGAGLIGRSRFSSNEQRAAGPRPGRRMVEEVGDSNMNISGKYKYEGYLRDRQVGDELPMLDRRRCWAAGPRVVQ